MENILNIKNISKVYETAAEKIYALNDVSLTLKKGELVALVGPSGSGKTTLLNIIGCLDKPTEGNVHISSNNIVEAKDKELVKIRSKYLGFVFQDSCLIPSLTALENVKLPSIFSNGNKNGFAIELLKLVGLENRLNHHPNQLSGGQMQRVAIARALVNNPAIVLADEPTGNLDTENRDSLIELFLKLKERGISFIIATHDTELASKCDRILKLKDGKVV